MISNSSSVPFVNKSFTNPTELIQEKSSQLNPFLLEKATSTIENHGKEIIESKDKDLKANTSTLNVVPTTRISAPFPQVDIAKLGMVQI